LAPTAHQVNTPELPKTDLSGTNSDRDIAFSRTIQFLGYQKRIVEFYQFIFGDPKLLTLQNYNSLFAETFTDFSSDNSDLGNLISPAESTAIPALFSSGDAISVTTKNNFIQRWNSTFFNWKNNNLASPSNDFIDYFTLQSMYQNILEDHKTAIYYGYSDVIQGFADSQFIYMNKLLESNQGKKKFQVENRKI
jgi:hypothetical protein